MIESDDFWEHRNVLEYSSARPQAFGNIDGERHIAAM